MPDISRHLNENYSDPLLPLLPLMLLTCLPRRLSVASGDDAAVSLACGMCLVNAGILVNAMLAVIAR